jgi:glutaminase
MPMNQPLAISPVQQYLERLHAELQTVSAGEVASYIPELTRADPDWLGIALVTVDGHVYQVGDSRQPFTVQSISKAVSYGLALEDRGLDAVLSKVGVEPTGEAFNSISLEPDTGRPLNPMINAGAIATTGLIKHEDGVDPLKHLLEAFERYCGRALEIDEAVYRSESETGHRNRAIAHLLYGHGILDRAPDEVVDLYFRQCSMLVTARDLALMGACLANGGVNPVSGIVALKSDWVHRVLSIMSTCGMYDFSGGWIFNVGMPAKSGVGGGIMAVLPGQFGLGVFSPRLDEKGNSVRGIRVCERISRDFGLHLFNVAQGTSASVIRRCYDCGQAPSRRRRGDLQQRWLQQHGERIRVLELQGQLLFGSAESVTLQVLAALDDAEALIVDLKRLIDMDQASAGLLGDLCAKAQASGSTLFFTECKHLYPFRRHLQKSVTASQTPDWLSFNETDRALEWCESALLLQAGLPEAEGQGPALESQYLFAGFNEAELDAVRAAGAVKRFAPDTLIVKVGEPADCLYAILEGEAEVWVPTEEQPGKGGRLRLTTLGPATVFGEIGLLSDQDRTANVTAQSPMVCLQVPFAALDDALRAKMLVNLAAHFAEMLKRNARLLQYLA